jgi:hypothetical protein
VYALADLSGAFPEASQAARVMSPVSGQKQRMKQHAKQPQQVGAAAGEVEGSQQPIGGVPVPGAGAPDAFALSGQVQTFGSDNELLAAYLAQGERVARGRV